MPAAKIDEGEVQERSGRKTVYGVRRTGDRSVEYHSSSAYELIRTFKVVCTMISAAVEEDYG